MKRSGKFYRNNERDVMEELGLKPTPNSGSGWIVKEDGQSDNLICQLKSTDAQSIKINQKDLRILEYNAAVSHKLPVFAIQFLNTGEIWLVVKPSEIFEISNFIYTHEPPNIDLGIDLGNSEEMVVEPKRVIKSSGNAREDFHKEMEQKYDKTKYAK